MRAVLLQLVLGVAAIAQAQQLYRNQPSKGTDDDKRNFDRDFLHFGKRDDVDFGREFMPFGKRDEFDRDFLHFGKKSEFDREFMPFGKKSDPFGREFLPFGKRGKRDAVFQFRNPMLPHMQLAGMKKDSN